MVISFIYKSHFLFNGNRGTGCIRNNLQHKDSVSAGVSHCGVNSVNK